MEYYTETRYPDFNQKIPAESFSKSEIKNVIKQCKGVMAWVGKYLTSRK